jgi:hypothetical protein
VRDIEINEFVNDTTNGAIIMPEQPRVGISKQTLPLIILFRHYIKMLLNYIRTLNYETFPVRNDP